MRSVKIKVADLLKKVKVNREEHESIFQEALAGYKTALVKQLETKLEAAKKGRKTDLNFDLVEPINKTKDYDRVIAMLEMSSENVVDLSESEFAQYVMDDWSWKNQFLTSNATYSHKAALSLS